MGKSNLITCLLYALIRFADTTEWVNFFGHPVYLELHCTLTESNDLC